MLNPTLLAELRAYVEAHENRQECIVREIGSPIPDSLQDDELERFIKTSRKPVFNQLLFALLTQKGAVDTEVYKRAGLDRRHFSKIRNPEYRPGKNTAIALALALELNKKEAGELLRSAGYSLSDSDTFDLVIQFCLEKKIYDLQDVNQALLYFSLKPLAGVLE